MAARLGVLVRVPVGRVVATAGGAALLTRPQVDPLRADLHALITLPALGLPDGGDRGDVSTRFVGHGLVLLGGTCSQSNGAQVPRVPGGAEMLAARLSGRI